MAMTFSKSTDSEHEIELESSIVSAYWVDTEAVCGGKVTLRVEMSLVGWWAPIEITVRTEAGKKITSFEDRVRRDVFVKEIDVPEDLKATDSLFFEVKLPDNDLEAQAVAIPVIPLVKVTEAKWSKASAYSGELVKLSAKVTGVKDATECSLIVYEYDGELCDPVVELDAVVQKERVELNWEFRYQGDPDDILTQAELQKYGKSYHRPSYFFTVRISGEEYGRRSMDSGFLILRQDVAVSLALPEGGPAASKTFKLELADGSSQTETLSDTGSAVVKDVPPGPWKATLM